MSALQKYFGGGLDRLPPEHLLYLMPGVAIST